jgi:hypothetical protein
MKNLIASICVFALRRLKYSAMIGYEINGGTVRCQNYNGLLYDNELNNVDYYVKDGTKFDIPPGKFSVSFPAKEVTK